MIRLAPQLVVVAGPSGVGKGTILRTLCALYPEVWLSVSATTRAPRSGEHDGVDYYFVDDARFDELVAAGGMLEWALVHGLERYGTLRGAVLDHLAVGRPVLLELDLEGARQVRAAMPDVLQVFIAPPSFEELARRLEGRATEGAEERARRLETARVELAAQGEFDIIVVNHEVERTVAELTAVMGLPAR